jgi:gentisate 1,2-dioxygenase
MNAPVPVDDAFHRLIHEHHMWGLWEIASQMTPHPRPDAVPYQWPWSLLQRVIKESATAVPVGDERRAMQLFNPGLGGQWATTTTLIAAVQVLLPGEVARSHRHSPSAIRFIMQGNGAYTAVEGENVVMREGDLVLTPNWQWHDHGNETSETVVWMDGLDVPLVKALNCMFFEMHGERKYTQTKPVDGLRPTRTKKGSMLLYPWDQTLEALHALRSAEGSPTEGVALEYTHPQTGGPVLPTIGCRVQMIRAGERLKARRVTGSSVFCVAQGSGRTMIDGRAFDWGKGDIVVLPSWALHQHANTGQGDAVLFSIHDRPVIEALGLYREETAAG